MFKFTVSNALPEKREEYAHRQVLAEIQNLWFEGFRELLLWQGQEGQHY
jgi:hypothetical protein